MCFSVLFCFVCTHSNYYFDELNVGLQSGGGPKGVAPQDRFSLMSLSSLLLRGKSTTKIFIKGVVRLWLTRVRIPPLTLSSIPALSNVFLSPGIKVVGKNRDFADLTQK